MPVRGWVGVRAQWVGVSAGRRSGASSRGPLGASAEEGSMTSVIGEQDDTITLD
jgi:hypothetical protein